MIADRERAPEGVRARRVTESPGHPCPRATLLRGAARVIGRRAAGLSVAVLLLTGGTAAASTVTLGSVDSCAFDIACSKYAGGTPLPVTVIGGAPGEANRITVTHDGEAWLIRDAGAPLTGHSGCTAVDASTVRCPITRPEAEGYFSGLRLNLGDGDDQALLGAAGVAMIVDGGPGADEVEGGAVADTIDGGEGADRLDGGGGKDTLDFAARTAGVRVDLGHGSTADGDIIAGFERVQGGSGPDTLLGGPAADTLRGGDGKDRLRGAGGDDILLGSDGSDRLEGDKGDDYLYGENHGDRLYGGAGDDDLVGDDENEDDLYEPPVFYGRDVLDGGAGNDRLLDFGGRNVFRGGRGNDRITGGEAPEAVTGGSGRDTIRVRGGGRDRVDCGTGRDTLRADARDSRRRC
jgi:Ca2+-binding RTX toxin-like protein